MANITAKMVQKLRKETNVGMMECKKALTESGGDHDKAMQLLRERGVEVAAKKSSREVKDGVVAARVSEDHQQGAIIEVDCETDFVTRNAVFKQFVDGLGEKSLSVASGELAESVKDELTAKIAEIGENIIVARNDKISVSDTGIIASYVHLGGKVGVLAEVACTKEESIAKDAFHELAKDITLHVAAVNPQALTREDIDQKTIDAEREIYKKQMEDKPDHIIDQIIKGKMDKFFAQNCLLEQGFVKDPDQSLTELLEEKGKELNDTFSIRKYIRYELGN